MSSAAWPELALAEWAETRDTLHLWTQIVGKVRLVQTPWINHAWHCTLYVTSRGLTTSPIPHGERIFSIDFDFVEHQLLVRTVDGERRSVALEPKSVASFYRELLVHRDMKRNWSRYPKVWGLKRPDPNIDHRRVPNLQVFFRRHGEIVRVNSRAGDYAAGDLVTWHLPSGLPHIGIVSDRRAVPSGRPLIVHNIGEGARIEDILFEYRITEHYRFVGTAADRR